MMSSSTDVDEIIESEVCNRLIRLSCAKMVNSQHTRGGARLHRNLLILHLLRRARDEQKRSPSNSPPLSPIGGSSNLSESASINSSPIVNMLEKIESVVDEDDLDVSSHDMVDSGQLLDLSSRSRCHENGDPVELKVLDDDLDYSSLNLSPLQLPFGTDLTEVEELTGCSGPSLMLNSDSHHFHEQNRMISPHMPFCDESEIDDRPPMCFTAVQDDPSSSSESEDDEEYKNGETSRMIRRRKRKTSTPRTISPTDAKKCCIQEPQLNGLISVFNSGLSVVAEKFLPRSSANVILPSSSDHVVASFVSLSCGSPLVC